MRAILCTTDTHLDDNPDNEYRWEIFDLIRDAISAYEIAAVFIAGDLCDKKDKHSSGLVNRVVTKLTRIASTVPVYILKGNHDQPLTGPAYWQFLNEIQQVRFIDEPVIDRGCLFLPHTRNPAKDWAPHWFKLPFKAIIMHQTVKGARDGGVTLQGEPMPSLPDVPIYSGDIHVQQRVGNVEYIGAPHPVRFGDSYPCRMLLLREDNLTIAKEIKINSIQKAVVDISSVDNLKKLKSRKADQIRVRFTMPAANLAEWPKIQVALENWAFREGVELMSVQPVLTMQPKEAAYNQWGSPAEVLRMFAASEGIEGDLLTVGLGLLEE